MDLSNVEYTLKVTDTATGATREYKNPIGQFASVGATAAFPGVTAGAAASHETVAAGTTWILNCPDDESVPIPISWGYYYRASFHSEEGGDSGFYEARG